MTSTEPNLRRAAKAAYRMRKKYDANDCFPYFDVFILPTVEKRLKVCRYDTFCNMNGMDYTEFMRGISHDGFSLREGRRYIIVYNDAAHIPEARKRFTIAHELGHYTLSHRVDGDKEEAEADCFARHLLAPIWLAREKGIDFPNYPRVFGISAAAARMCEKMQSLDLDLSEKLYKKANK